VHLIDYVDGYGKLWGRARRRFDLNLERWPQSVGGRIQDGIPPETFREQRFPELFTGEVLIFNLALRILTERQKMYIYVHYVIPLPTNTKIRILKTDRGSYYGCLSMAHRKIANVIDYGCNAANLESRFS
jgi:hypothetical protein